MTLTCFESEIEMTKELKKMMKQNDMELIRQKKHLIWRHKTLGFKVTTAKTPSDWRSLKNTQRCINKEFALAA
jgi:hypothetical protein